MLQLPRVWEIRRDQCSPAMERITKITAPAGDKLRQLQKIVHDIKNNEGGIMQRFKKIKNQAPPSVPRRDYGREPPEDDGADEWSDEFDGDYDDPDEQSDQDTYVEPNEPDQNYEPPPNENGPKFTAPFKLNDSNGGYADKNQHRRPPPSHSNGHANRPTRPLPKPNEAKAPQPAQPLHGRMAVKPSPKPLAKPAVMPRQQAPPTKNPRSLLQKNDDEEEDYIVPDEDYNYIDPTETSQPAPKVDRAKKPNPPGPSRPPHRAEPEVYDVPDDESKPSPPVRKTPPRRNSPKPDAQEGYEACDDFLRRPDPPVKPAPAPHPRNWKSKPLVPVQRSPGLPPRDVNSNIENPSVPRPERLRLHSAGPDPPSGPPSNFNPRIPAPTPKSNVISAQKPPENRYVTHPSNTRRSNVEQDAGVLDKEWYSSSCDRKAAEDALQASSKDGSFLVRKSTGHNPKQPFTLVVFYNRKVYNIPVRYIESTRKYALGREKSGEEKFSSVAEMIENHQRTQLVLIDSQSNTKDFTKLSHPIKVP